MLKRTIRDLTINWSQYILIVLLYVTGISVVIGSSAAATSAINSITEGQDKSNLENGEFILATEAQEGLINEARDGGFLVEYHPYTDVELKKEVTLRVMPVREKMNRLVIDEGSVPQKDKDVVLEKKYAEKYKLKVGDTLELLDDVYEVCGIGSVPDYGLVTKNYTDVAANPAKFGLCFVVDDTFKSICDKEGQQTIHCYGFQSDDDKEVSVMKNLLDDSSYMDMNYVVYFLATEDNSRVNDSKNNAEITKSVTLLMGISVMIVLAYIVSMLMSHKLERESSIIGIFYAMGYSRKKLYKTYIFVPVIITLVSAGLGVLIGILEVPLMNSTSLYYSVPNVETTLDVSLFVYGIVLPTIICFVVNTILILRKLDNSPLDLLRDKKDDSIKGKFSKIRIKSPVRMFRFRHFVYEMKRFVIMIIGVFFALYLLIYGVMIYESILFYTDDITEKVKYENMYILNEEIETPENAQAGKLKQLTLWSDTANKKFPVNVYGLMEDDKYFGFEGNKNKNELVISEAVAEKYAWKEGTPIVLKDSCSDKEYEFTVVKTVDFPGGLAVFTNDAYMEELFDDDYSNVLFSEKELDIDDNLVQSIVTKSDMIDASKQLVSAMSVTIFSLMASAIIVFVISIIIIMRLIVDHSKYSISMLKIMGFSRKKISSMMGKSSFFIVLLTVVVFLPLCKIMVAVTIPTITANVATAMKAYLPILDIVVIFVGTALLYFGVEMVQKYFIERIEMNDVLKNRMG